MSSESAGMVGISGISEAVGTLTGGGGGDTGGAGTSGFTGVVGPGMGVCGGGVASAGLAV